MENYRKLVRDRIPEILDQKGVPYEVVVADIEAYRVALIEKLKEEMLEFYEAYDPEELADVIEVIEALKKLPEYGAVEGLRVKKREERGGFDGMIILKGKK